MLAGSHSTPSGDIWHAARILGYASANAPEYFRKSPMDEAGRARIPLPRVAGWIAAIGDVLRTVVGFCNRARSASGRLRIWIWTSERQQMRATLCVIALGLFTIVYRTRAPDNPDTGLQQWKPPSPETIPQGPLGDSIRLGRLIFTQTPKHVPAYVGNQQSCSDCHLAAGTAPFAAPVVGLPGLFPIFDQRQSRDHPCRANSGMFSAQRERPSAAL